MENKDKLYIEKSSHKECNCHKEEKTHCSTHYELTHNKKTEFHSSSDKEIDYKPGGCSCSGHKDRSQSTEGSSESGKEDMDQRPGDCSSCVGCNDVKHETEGCGCSSHMSLDHGLGGCCSVPKKVNKRGKTLVYLIVSIVSVIASYLLSQFDVYSKLGSHKLAVLDPAWIAIVISGTPIFKAALYNLKRKKITSALLVSMAIIASITIGFIAIFGGAEVGSGHNHGFFFAAAEVSVIMAIGEVLEELTLSKSKSAIKNLIKTQPSTAMRKNETGEFESVGIEDILVGDIVLIRPNEIISVDGEITHGETSIDASNITGEFLAKDSYIGDKVYSGTKNLAGAIEVVVETPSGETTISKLIKYIDEASKKKAPVVKLADKWAGYLVVGSLIVSMLVLIISLFGFRLSHLESVQRAATVLVVFCPCALALATPVAIAAAIGNASKNGILIKSGLALEKITKIDTVAFDKTGTLTEGKIKIERLYPYQTSEKDLIIYAASVESKSEHPIAKAILEYNNYDLLESTKTESILGVGVEAIIDNKKVGVYKLDYVKDSMPTEAYQNIEQLGYTVISVLLDGKYIGSIALSDTLREDIVWSVEELKKMRKECVMLTGDTLDSARMIGNKVGIEHIQANLLPEDKVKIIEDMKKDGKKVLMIGDGVNDAAALASADSSIAIAAMGSSVAMETAEISLMTKNIKKIPYLFHLSKRTLLTIKINITLSLIISIISIILSALGYVNIVAGALIHNASSVLVALHSALLLTYKRKEKNSIGHTKKVE